MVRAELRYIGGDDRLGHPTFCFADDFAYAFVVEKRGDARCTQIDGNAPPA